MTLYITYNDAPSGIYSSQVIDVVKFLRSDLNEKIKLLAYISIRNFFFNRKKIKSELTDAIVLPMFPGISRWTYNQITLWFLCLVLKPKTIIGRSVLATHLALKNRKKGRKIIYDGRGAIAAEWKEYKVVEDLSLLNDINRLEREAVLNTDFRIAVSDKLLEFWSREFTYHTNNHVVIPCTLNKQFETLDLTAEKISESRVALGLGSSEIVYVYSGSIAGWQSFELLYNTLRPILIEDSKARILFLSAKDDNIIRLEKEFPGKIICIKVAPEEVPSYLLAGDYGLLIREKSLTNKVASPVKFAEYLACGLPVIISEELGDYTDFVQNYKCGFLVGETKTMERSLERKLDIHKRLTNHFLKRSYLKSYSKVIT